MLKQAENNPSAVKKKLIIKGQQKILGDALTLIKNVVVLERYWIIMDFERKTTYPCIIQLLVELVNTLSVVEFRKFEGKFKFMYLVMTHTLIDYIFSLFQQFVKLTQNLYGVRFARVVEYMTAECVYLLEELVCEASDYLVFIIVFKILLTVSLISSWSDCRSTRFLSVV